MTNGGEIASRGFIFQSIVALIECLNRDDWDEIKVELKDVDKVDIVLYREGHDLTAIQVKSSVNSFNKNNVEQYLTDAKVEAPDAKEVMVYLITDRYTASIKKYVQNNPDIKEYPFEYLQTVCKGKLTEYINIAGLGQEVTVANLELIYKTLFATVILNSIAKETISRDAFEAEFQKAIPIQRNNKSLPVIPQCLTPIPTVNQTVGLIGRDEIVKTVRNLLEINNRNVLLNGLGGIGKTAVMQYVCNELKDEGHYVAWFKWESSLKDGLLLLRDSLGIPKGEKADEAYELVVKRIKNHLARKLYLFIDDLTKRLDNDEINLLNSLQIHVMVTSRFEYEYFKNLPLGVLEKNEAIDMFFRYYKRVRNPRYEDTAWNIIDSINSHTLMVELLAKAARAEGGTLEKFYSVLSDKGFFEVSDEEVLSDHDKEYRTIEQSIIKLYEISKLSDSEQHIMRLFTIFTPEKAIYSKVRDWADLDKKAMRRLVELGWLDLEGGYVIHQIVKDSLLHQVGEVRIEDYGNLLDKVIETDSYLSVTETYEVVRERIVLTEDIARFLGEKKEKDTLYNNVEKKDMSVKIGELYNNIAGVFKAQGEYKKAHDFYKKALDARMKLLGASHADIATIYNNIANVYRFQGDYNNSLKYHRKALVIREEILGLNHRDTATSYNNMANVYYSQGDYSKALEHYRKALFIREKALGMDHHVTAGTYNNMAGVYRSIGDYESAILFYEKALSIREKVLGTDHPDTASTYNGIANVYFNRGSYEEALLYYKKAQTIREKVLGTGHPDTATTYNNLSKVYRAQGECEKALEYYGKALAIREGMLGTEHPDTATTYNNMAGVYQDQGDYAKAIEYYRKAMTIRERMLGVDHPDMATTYNNIAGVYQDQGDYVKAQEYFEKALRIREHVLGTDHPDTATTYNNIAVLYLDQCDYVEALEYLWKALTIRERILGANHPDTATTYNDLAVVYRARGDYAEALEYLKKALNAFIVILGEDHPNTINIRENMRCLLELIKHEKTAN